MIRRSSRSSGEEANRKLHASGHSHIQIIIIKIPKAAPRKRREAPTLLISLLRRAAQARKREKEGGRATAIYHFPPELLTPLLVYSTSELAPISTSASLLRDNFMSAKNMLVLPFRRFGDKISTVNFWNLKVTSGGEDGRTAVQRDRSPSLAWLC